MLTLLGAGSAVLIYENVRIKKDVSNHVNRQMNCDQSNINRVVDAAEAQIRDIQYIDHELGLKKLPKSLREMAEVRVNNPATSLSGLGELLNPPIGYRSQTISACEQISMQYHAGMRAEKNTPGFADRYSLRGIPPWPSGNRGCGGRG